MKQFHVSDVLCIGTGRLVSFRGFGAVYDVLNFMTGDDLFTHVLPRAQTACQPAILARYPWMGALDCSTITAENYKQWVADAVREHLGLETTSDGPMLDVEALPPGAWGFRNPLVEAAEMVGIDRIVVVTT